MQQSLKSIRKIDFYNPNFEEYFVRLMDNITDEQREKIPFEYRYKVYGGGKTAKVEKLSFGEKIFISEVVFGKTIIISVSDYENGINCSDVGAAVKARQQKIKNSEALEAMEATGTFILSGKNFTEALMYMNHLQTSGIYNLVRKHVPNANHHRNKQYLSQRDSFLTMIKFLLNYEANKRQIPLTYQGMDMPAWWALLYFQEERFAKDFYNKDLKYAYNSDKSNLHKGMKRIHAMGLLVHRRIGKQDKYVISAKGAELLSRIVNTILLKPF